MLSIVETTFMDTTPNKNFRVVLDALNCVVENNVTKRNIFPEFPRSVMVAAAFLPLCLLWRFYLDQAYSCPRVWRFSASWVPD